VDAHGCSVGTVPTQFFFEIQVMHVDKLTDMWCVLLSWSGKCVLSFSWSELSHRFTQPYLVPPLRFFTPLHHMFGHMHGVLNVDKKITNYTDCDKFAR
jgi:hypothetical protein